MTMAASKRGATTTLWFIFHLLLVFSSTGHQKKTVDTIVVLVLENRSFDHMLGWMKRSINPRIDGLTGRECNDVVGNKMTTPATVCVSDDAEFVDPDPGHTFEAVQQQVFGSGETPAMNGFVQQALSVSVNLSQVVMRGFKPEALPIFSTLVSEFAVFDRWFSSIPGPTQPNRLFVYSGTSCGAVQHDKLKLAAGYPQKTIFDSLHHDGIDFGIYYQTLPSTLFYRNLRKLRFLTKKFHRHSKFLQHSKEGKLPSFTVIEPRYFDLKNAPANDDHPSHDVANGQMLVKEIYEALRSSPQWNQILFIITYDEHGGFYDHVPTPTGIPSPDGIISPDPTFFRFDRLGVRVPTIMVSPWIPKGKVVGRPNGPLATSEFEHSSIPATVKKIFNLSSPFLTQRDAWAGTFEDVTLELASPRTDCPEVLPEVRPLRHVEPDEDRHVSEFQSELIELAAILTRDKYLMDSVDQTAMGMHVKEANEYVGDAVERFMANAVEAVNLGADDEPLL